MSGPLRHTPKGNFLHLRVTPKSGCDEICGLMTSAGDTVALAVKVTAIPDKGKANEAVIALLAKAIGVAKSSFNLVNGETSRNKVLAIVANQDAVINFIAKLDRV